MRRNINVQENNYNIINNSINNRRKSNNPITNKSNINNNNNQSNNTNNFNRAQSSNKLGNNNLNQNGKNGSVNQNKNFKNLKANNKQGVTDSAVISSQNYQIFQNQDYFKLDNFNFYGNANKNDIDNITNKNNTNNNNYNNNSRGNPQNQNNNNIKYFPNEIATDIRKPNTTTVNSQIRFDDYNTNNNDNNQIKGGKKHFNNNQNFDNNININQTKNINSNLNRNSNNEPKNFSKETNHNISNNNKNNVNNNPQNKNYSKTILLKIKAAKSNGIINISNMNLNSLPREIFDDSVRYDDINWWELTDIKKIDATNNQIDETFNNENISFEAIPNLNYLKFSGNNFSMIPDSIYSLYNLKFLDFADNKLRNLSDNIRGLKSLVDLNLSNNSINALPNEIGRLPEIEILNISQNKISAIPQGIANLTKLKKLDLNNNFLDSIPSFIGSLYNLEELILFKNKIKQIQNNSLSRLANIKYLDLHNNNLDSFTEIPKSDKLDTLILGYNRIEKIENLRNSPNLTVLDINNNKLENFPDDVLNLKNIITLNIMNNSINDIPPALCYLNKLVRLNIEGNPLRKINSKIRSSNAEQIKSYLKTRIVGDEENDYSPNQNNNNHERMNNDSEMDQNENYSQQNNNKNDYIQRENNKYNFVNGKESNINLLNNYQKDYLKVMNMDIENIPIENFKKCKIFSCIGMDLSNNKIRDLSFFEHLPIFNEMQELKINLNKLTVLSPNILNFKNLRILEMKNNLLNDFFEDIDLRIYELSNMNTNTPDKNINKPRNNLNQKNSNNFYERNKTQKLLNHDDDLKQEIDNKPFPNLEYLDLSNNKIRNFPRIIKFCTKLNTLLLSNNLLTNIDSITEINNPTLFTLEFGTNKITALPEKLYKTIPNIKHIGLENNELKGVPTDLCFMKNLNKLTLNGNPIKLLRSNIINGGTKYILEYLRKMHRFTDEELKLEGQDGGFMNFGEFPDNKPTNKRFSYKNQQSPMEIDDDQKSPISPKPNKLHNNLNNNFNNDDTNKSVKQSSEKMDIENNNYTSNNAQQQNFGSHQDEIDDINRQILIVESEMAEGNLPMFKKTDLRRKLNELIRKRANIMKNIDS